MPTYRKRGDTWQVQVFKKVDGVPVRRSTTRRTKAQCEAWAAKILTEIDAIGDGQLPDKTVSELLERYAEEISSKKRGKRWEEIRIAQMRRDEMASVPLRALNETHCAAWRDRRLREVSPASVRREWNLWNHVFNVAINEWRWLRENPLKRVKRPDAPPARTRRIADDEIERLCFALGYRRDRTPETDTARVAAAMLFSIETAMRAGEIAGLTWERVDTAKCCARLETTKNGHPRDVPLSAEALRILKQVGKCDLGKSVFGLKPHSIDSLFRKGKSRALIEDLHFHDMRREALTRMAEKLSPLELARVSGHRDLKILLNVYYAPKVEDLAAKLG